MLCKFAFQTSRKPWHYKHSRLCNYQGWRVILYNLLKRVPVHRRIGPELTLYKLEFRQPRKR